MALGDATSQTIAQIVQGSLGEAGITVDVRPTEDATYWSLGDRNAGEGYKPLGLTLMSYAGGVEPTGNLVWLRTDRIGAYNWSSFHSPEIEDLFQAAQTETDEAERRRVLNRMEDLMESSGGFVFIAFEPYAAIHARASGP